MEFQFPFSAIAIPRPVISLQGRKVRPRPMIPFVVINPRTGACRSYRGLLDTGADDTVFQDETAVALGIDLTNAPTGTVQGATGQTMTVRYAEVFLQIANDEDAGLEWRATVAFAPKRGTHPILGFAGFLQFFDTTFHGELEEVTLIPSGNLPRKTPTTFRPH
jgi:hypothetical protein